MRAGPSSFVTRPIQELFGRHPGYGFAGIGVSTAIGNYTETDADLAFPGDLLGLLDWARTSNSRSTATGVLGVGWSTTFSARLTITQQGIGHNEAGPVQFHDADGRVLAFTPNPAGGFTRPQDLDADLSRNADGTFTLTYNSGEAWSFDASGRLTGKALEEQTVTLEYDAAGLLLQAVHSFGRYINFTYDGNGQLTAVQTNDGRTVSYAYGADGTLSSATLPGGGIVQYASTNGLISRVTGPDGNLVVANTYADGLVSRQDFAAGGAADFSYDTATGVTTVTSRPTGAQVTFQADAHGRMTRVTDPSGNTATFAYDPNGRLVQATTPGGTQLTQSYDANGNVLTSAFGGATSSWTYDSADRVITATDPAGAVTSFGYTGDSHIASQITGPDGGVTRVTAANGLVTAQTDADGSVMTWAYDPAGNLVSFTNPLGGISLFSYDPAGNRTQAASPSGRTTAWTYDGAGRVLAITGPDGATTSYRYSAAGLLLAMTDPTGATTSYAYDAAGNQTQVTDPLGSTSTLAYDEDGNLIALTDPAGAVTRCVYDALGQLVSVTDPLGVVYQFTYDADGDRLTEQGPSGVTTSGYDARGNVISITTPAGEEWRFEYDLADRPTVVSEPGGAAWQTAYDAAGRPITSTNPLGAVTTRQWTLAGKLVSTTDPLGRKVSLGYDADGNITAAANPEGGVTRYAYDPDGRRISATTPAGLVTQYRYDRAGRVTAIVNARGWMTRHQYNARGDLTQIVSPSGAVKRIRYDPAGQVTGTTDPNGSTTEYAYDNAGNLTSVTDAKGAVTRFTYDANGQQTSSTDPLDRTTTRAYDGDGDLITITGPDGRAQRLTYDADRRLTGRAADDGTTVSFTYDNSGRRASMTDATGTTRYAYDAAGQLTTVTEPDGTTIVSGYDKAGQRTSLAYPGGLELGYQYDLNGRLTALHDPRAGDAVYALDPDGRLLTEQLPGRLARRYHYEHGRLSGFLAIRDGHPVTEMSFTRDPDDQIVTWRDPGRMREYRYDPAGQLVRVMDRRTGPGPARPETHFTYDEVGNRTSLRRGETETRYRYDVADQLLAHETGEHRVDYRYDTTGRLVEQADGGRRRRIDYDGFGRPTAVTRTADGRTERSQATYNGVNLLSALTLTARDEGGEEEHAASVRYLWSVGGRIAQVISQRAEPRLNDAGHGQPAPLNADFAYGYGRTFASWEHGAATFHRDAFGSAVRTEDTSAWVQASGYGTFGEPEDDQDTGPDRQEDRERGTRPPALPRFGYRGELALGPMVYLRARAYDTALGRFTTRDPVTVLRGLGHLGNPYVYVNNDPLNFIDPRGQLAFPFLGGAGEVLASPKRRGRVCPHGCPVTTADDLTRHRKCFQKLGCMWTRGHLNQAALDNNPRALDFYYAHSQREAAAHAFTIHALNAIAAGFAASFTSSVGKVTYSYGVDWEVSNTSTRRGQHRPDILVDEENILDVGEYSAGVEGRIATLIQQEIGFARNYWNGMVLKAGTALMSWAGRFKLTSRNATIYVWGHGNPAGHIYFADSADNRIRTQVKVRAAAPQIGPPLTVAGAAAMVGSDLANMWPTGTRPTTQSPPGSFVRSPDYDDPDLPTNGAVDGGAAPSTVGGDDADVGGDFGDFF
jgi:RHS repeat-associated protein